MQKVNFTEFNLQNFIQDKEIKQVEIHNENEFQKSAYNAFIDQVKTFDKDGMFSVDVLDDLATKTKIIEIKKKDKFFNALK